MKTKTLAILLLIFTSSYTFGQKILTIDFDSIKVKITDSASKYYYPLLIDRFVKADTTLTNEEYYCIYYGNVFSENYNPYSTSKNEEKFMELYYKGQYKKAIPFGEKVLKDNPVNLTISFKMLVCYNVLGDTINVRKYAYRHLPLLNVIRNSGDGKSFQTAYVVINVKDEYDLLSKLELSVTRQALADDTDILTTKKEDEKEGQETIDFYFNVRMPLDYLDKEFIKSNK